MTWGMGGGEGWGGFSSGYLMSRKPRLVGVKKVYSSVFKRTLYSNKVVRNLLAFVPFWVIFKMVTCGILDYGNSWTKSKTIEVKGWHKVPTSNKVERMEWLYVMKRVPLYPSDENFYWQSPLCGQSLRARFKSTYSCSYCL